MTDPEKPTPIFVPPLLYSDAVAELGEDYAKRHLAPVPQITTAEPPIADPHPNTAAARRLMRKLGGPRPAAATLHMDPRTLERIYAGKRPASDTLLRQLQDAIDAR